MTDNFQNQIQRRSCSNKTEFVSGAHGGELWTQRTTPSSTSFNGNLGQWIHAVASPMERRNYFRFMRLLSDFEKSCELYVHLVWHFPWRLTRCLDVRSQATNTIAGDRNEVTDTTVGNETDLKNVFVLFLFLSVNNRPRHRSQFDESLPRAVVKRLQKQLQKYYKAVRCSHSVLSCVRNTITTQTFNYLIIQSKQKRDHL